MFAPKPFDVAKEMVRVTRPGGRIVMGNWIPERSDVRRPDSEDQLRLLAAAAGRVRQPDDVGDREQRRRALCAAGVPSANVAFFRDTYNFRLSRIAVGVCCGFQKLLRPDHERVRRGREERKSRELQQELETLFERENRSDVQGTTSIPATFLRVTVSR